MKNAILVHGWSYKDEYYDPKYPTGSNSHWFPWLTKQLMINDIHTVAVEMPTPFFPEYHKWRKEFERLDINRNTILVGHSCGGGFLIRWLSEKTEVSINKLILVAPWVGTDPDQPFDSSFFDFQWDRNLCNRMDELIMFNSTNDVASIKRSEEIIKQRLSNIKVIELENKGHFTLHGLKTEQFPELLSTCIA